jgi:hypothetical protein
MCTPKKASRTEFLSEHLPAAEMSYRSGESMSDERWGCPFEHLGLCGLNLETGKKMSHEDIMDSNAPCGFNNKLECDWRNKHAPHHAIILRPGACTADAKTIRDKIRAREKGIESIKSEIARKQENINTMAQEIAEYRALRLAKHLCPECEKPLHWEQWREVWFCQDHGHFTVPAEDICAACQESCIDSCAMCVDRPWKRQTSKQYSEAIKNLNSIWPQPSCFGRYDDRESKCQTCQTWGYCADVAEASSKIIEEKLNELYAWAHNEQAEHANKSGESNLIYVMTLADIKEQIEEMYPETHLPGPLVIVEDEETP